MSEENRQDPLDEWVPPCAGYPDAFFPQEDSLAYPLGTNFPKSICASCPVREECLEVAIRAEVHMSSADAHGIWGGLTPMQRRPLVKALKLTMSQEGEVAA